MAKPGGSTMDGSDWSTLSGKHSVIVAGGDRLWPNLRRLFSAQPSLPVVDCAGTAKEVSALCRRLSPCVLIADRAMISEFNRGWLLAEVRSGGVQVLIHFPGGIPNEDDVEALLRMGCMGVLGQNTSAATVKKAVLAVISGELWASRKLMSRLLRQHLQTEEFRLTQRESEILRLIGEGWKNRQIADRLFISVKTVRWHLRSVYYKLGITDRQRAELFAAAVAGPVQ